MVGPSIGHKSGLGSCPFERSCVTADVPWPSMSTAALVVDDNGMSDSEAVATLRAPP